MKNLNKTEFLNYINDVIEKGPFDASWESLTNFEIPSWFKKEKFGIFVHWGIFSVPAFNNEWYSRNMYVKDSDEYKHHIETYGPHSEFGYKDFIPMFTADKFDPKEWIRLFKRAGAGYIVPVAEHHDGFQMYQTGISKWNSVDMGPKKDILGELKKEIEDQGLVFCTSSHRAEHYWFMGVGQEFESDIKEPMVLGDFYWPSLKEQPDQQNFYSNPYPPEDFLEDWLIRTCELINEYKPKILYFDWWIQHEGFKPYLKKIAAFYYNKGIEWNSPTAICYKHDAMAFGSGIVDVERGKFADSKPYYWQTDTAVAHNSWCYTTSLNYKSSYEILCYLIDVISKNGNLLLNIGPKSDGTIPEGDLSILNDLGDWMDVNREAIHSSKPWRVSAEGPTAETEGQFSDGNKKEYTSQDFRFTSGNGCIYAFCMKPADDDQYCIASLADSEDQNKPKFHGIIRSLELLGSDEKIDFSKDAQGLKFSAKTTCKEFPIVIKIHTD